MKKFKLDITTDNWGTFVNLNYDEIVELRDAINLLNSPSHALSLTATLLDDYIMENEVKK